MRVQELDPALLDIVGLKVTPCHETYEVWGSLHHETTYEVEWSKLYYRDEELTDIDEGDMSQWIVENYVD